MKRDTHLAVPLLLFIGCSLASLTVWKVLASRDRALEDVNVHGLNLTQALATYSEGIVRQSSLLLLGLVERLETKGSGPLQIRRLSALVDRQQPLMPAAQWYHHLRQSGTLVDVFPNRLDLTVGANSSDRAYFYSSSRRSIP